jgi:chromosome segregation ATPase
MQTNGTREYRNTGDTRGCKKLDLPDVSMIPAPRTQLAKAADSADPQFPKIDSSTQKRRDQDRMQILQDEIRSEEEKLSGLKKEYQNGEPERQGNERNYAKYQERVALLKDEVTRTEKNIEALKREISNLK